MSLPVIFLMGATATGKTDLAISLFAKYPTKFSLISVDSALIYRGLDIGSAKPSQELLRQYPHHLINIIDAEESYSVGKFFKDACRLIDQAHHQKKIPILVGGTMMYFRSFFALVNNLPRSNVAIRSYVNQLIDDYGVEKIHDLLSLVDPVTHQNLQVKDKQRIGRAIEIFLQTGKIMSELQNQEKISHKYQIKLFAFEDNRSLIHHRIALRTRKMLKDGIVEEVIGLRQNSKLHLGLPSMRCVGYRQVWECLDGLFPQSELEERIIFATRQLAKRQITWLRSWPEKITYLPLNLPLSSNEQLIQDFTSNSQYKLQEIQQQIIIDTIQAYL